MSLRHVSTGMGVINLNEVADLTLEALDDSEHRLRILLDELLSHIKGENAQSPGSSFDYLLFIPPPRSRALPLQRYWHLQLLLNLTARTSRIGALVDRFTMSKDRITCALNLMIKDSLPLHPYLREALEMLEVPSDTLAYTLVGRRLTHRSGTVISLPAQPAAFLSVLMKKPGHAFGKKDFAAAGVHNPTETKSRLLKVLERNDVHEIQIHTSQLAYSLVTANSANAS